MRTMLTIVDDPLAGSTYTGPHMSGLRADGELVWLLVAVPELTAAVDDSTVGALQYVATKTQLKTHSNKAA